MKKSVFKLASLALAVFAIAMIAMVFGAPADTALVTGVTVSAAASAIYAFAPMPTGVLGAYVGATSMADGEMGVQVISSERERAILEHNRTQPRFKGKNVVPGYLRLETTIKNSQNILSFKTFEGDGASVYPTERRLDRNDAFIATEVGFFLLRQDVANVKTNGLLNTYVNLTTFAAAAGFTPADLNAIYQGRLSITINKVKKVPDIDLQRFLHIPETQQTGATNYDQRKYKDGFINLTPQVIIDGSGTNELEVAWPSYAGWQGASVTAGTEHRAVLYFRGLFVTGGSSNE
jgi:hypothetical protein